MKNIIIGILVILILIVPTSVFAHSSIATNIIIGNTPAINSSVKMTEEIIGPIQVIGSIVSVLALAIIGLRYMFSSVEEKASMKGVIIYYIIGAVLVFATSNVLGIVYKLFSHIEHTYDYNKGEVIKAATCVEEGEVKYKCLDPGCNETIVEIIPTTGGHTYGAEVTTLPTCTVNGSVTQTCSKCNDIKIKEELPAYGHNWSDWNIVQNAACTTEGREKKVCSNCHDSETRTIAALGHNWGDWNIVQNASCTTAGSEKKVCGNCNGSETRTIAATGHNWKDWDTIKPASCTTTGTKKRECGNSNCTDIESETIAAWGHDWREEKLEATCTSTGWRKDKCNRCGKVENGTYLPKLEHNWNDWEIIQAATCVTEGSQKRVCSNCSEEDTETIAGGHDWGDEEILVTATCIKTGTKGKRCKNCNATTDTHSYDDFSNHAKPYTQVISTNYKFVEATSDYEHQHWRKVFYGNCCLREGSAFEVCEYNWVYWAGQRCTKCDEWK